MFKWAGRAWVLVTWVSLCGVPSRALAACTADAWEQDDACATSAAIILGGASQERNFCDDAADWVTVQGCPGRVYTVQTSALGTSADTILDLYAPDCTTLLGSDDDGGGGKASSLTWTATAAGSYHVRVRQKDGTSGDSRQYTLTLAGNTSPCSTLSREFAAPDGSADREMLGVALASDGGLYAVGTYAGSESPIREDAWVLRLNGDGSTTWQKAYASTLWEHTEAIRANGSGEIVFAGQQSDSTTGQTWGYAAKVNAAGDLLWQTRLGGGDDYFNDVVPLDDGGAIVAGTLTSGSDTDGWLVRLSPTGATTWSKKYGGNAFDYFHAVAPAPDGSFVAAGGTASSGAGSNDVLVVKVDASGAVLWQKTLGGAGYDDVFDVSAGSDGSIFVAGYLEDPPGTTTGWIAKLDASGSLLWQREVSAGTGVSVLAVAALTDGGAAVTARYNQQNVGGWIARLDMSGSLVWQRFYPGLDGLNGVVALPDGGVAVAAFIYSGSAARVLHIDGSGAIASCSALQPGAATLVPGNAVLAIAGVSVKTASATAVTADLTASTQTDVTTDYCPCVNPVLTSTLYADKNAAPYTRLTWSGGTPVDVDIVRGDLPTLRSTGGNFAAALDALVNAYVFECVLSNGSGSSVDDTLTPDPGGGYFYVQRASAPVCPGTYDESVTSQVASRDWSIHLAGYECPP